LFLIHYPYFNYNTLAQIIQDLFGESIVSFREKYIKTGIFEKRLSNILGMLFEMRSESDYDDFYVISKPEVETQIENADYFLEQVKKYVR
jgi:uncharacterized protein (UPF0332 family)